MLKQSNSSLNNTNVLSTGPPKVCVSSIDKKGWSAEKCETINKKGKITCECLTINPTTVVSDFNGLFDSANT